MMRKLSLILVLAFSVHFGSFFLLAGDLPAIILIHGLAGSSSTWDDLLSEMQQNEFYFEANIFIKEENDGFRLVWKLNQNKLSSPDKYPVFTVDFGDNQNLSFDQQGVRINKLINEIYDKYKKDVVLACHSMGGLSARAAMMIDMEHIKGYFSAATPHAGSFLGLVKDSYEAGIIEKLLWEEIYIYSQLAIDLRPDAKAIGYLKPDSPEMKKLHTQIWPENLSTALLISNIEDEYLKIIMGKFIEVLKLKNPVDNNPLSFWSDAILIGFNDAVVPVPSQHLKSSVANAHRIYPKVYTTDRMHVKVTRDTENVLLAIRSILNDIKETGNENPVSTGKITIGFVLDSSGSMSTTDPDNIRIEASKRIVHEIMSDENIFLVDFDEKGELLNQNFTSTLQKNELLNCLSTIDSRGGTNIGAGLLVMQQALLNHSINYASTAIMLLTDGQGAYSNEIEWFKNNGIPVYTISYKDMADESLMELLASETNGIYYQANNSEDIIMAFREFYDDLRGYSKIFSGKYETESVVETDNFYIEPNIPEITISVSGKGFDKDLRLITPDGRVMLANSLTSDIIFGSAYVTMKILNPKSGSWRVVISAAKPYITYMGYNGNYNTRGPNPEYGLRNNDPAPHEKAEVLVEVSALSPMKMKLDVKKDEIGNISLDFSDSQNTINYEKSIAEVLIKSEDGSLINSKASYKNGKIRFIPTKGEGNYQVDVKMKAYDNNNQLYERYFKRSVLVDAFTPGYMGVISRKIGGYVYTNQGNSARNRPGINVEVFSQESGGIEIIARGYVTYVTNNGCTIELTKTTKSPKEGDIVVLNFSEWTDD